MIATLINPREALWTELWTSLTSLLRSYTAVHGLQGSLEADVDFSPNKIMVRHGEKWLSLIRDHATVTWTRENGSNGSLQLNDHGHFVGPEGEQAMDLAAEQWARELMVESPLESSR